MTFAVSSLAWTARLALDASGRFVLGTDHPALAWTVGRPWTQVRPNLEYRKRWTVEPVDASPPP